jgi:hypothetical protein
MYTHCVFFWLGESLDDAERESFAADLRRLIELPGVSSGTVGRPAPSDHPVIDRSYSWGLTIVCSDADRYRLYAEHPVRRAFLERWFKRLARIAVYDFQP